MEDSIFPSVIRLNDNIRQYSVYPAGCCCG